MSGAGDFLRGEATMYRSAADVLARPNGQPLYTQQDLFLILADYMDRTAFKLEHGCYPPQPHQAARLPRLQLVHSSHSKTD